jgi:hypothetical protein
MPWESIGTVNTGQMPHEEDWILFALGLAKSYVLWVCGPPPEGSSLDVMWHDHELGSYPSLGIWCEWAEASHYYTKAEGALFCFDQAIDWWKLKSHFEESFDDDDADDDG